MGDVLRTATNVHKLGHVRDVRWTVLCAPAPALHGGGDQIVISFQLLREAIQELRNLGHHVYHRPPEAVLWFFTLSTGVEGYQDIESVFPSASRYGLQALITGSLKSREADGVPRTVVHGVLGAGKKRSKSTCGYPEEWRKDIATRQAFISAETILRSSPYHLDRFCRSSQVKDPLAGTSVRSVFVVALQRTISVALAEAEILFPVASANTQNPRPALARPTSSRSAGDSTWLSNRAYALDAAWDGNTSTLLVVCSRSASQGRPCQCNVVTLAPYGWSGEIVGGDEDGDWTSVRCSTPSTDHLRRALRIPKQGSETLLAHEALGVASYGKWRRLLVPPTRVDSSKRFIIEWPELLCLQHYGLEGCSNWAQGSSRGSSSLPAGSPTDALYDAEKWHNEKAIRDAQIQAEKKALASANRFYQTASDEQAENYDTGVNRRLLDLQNGAGVYPTPPDANKPPSRGQTGSYDGTGAPSLGDEEPQQQDPHPDADSLMTNNPEMGRYDRFEDDGLLEELDRTMDSNNGITEADFNFFDEPDAAEPLEDVDLAAPGNRGGVDADDHTDEQVVAGTLDHTQSSSSQAIRPHSPMTHSQQTSPPNRDADIIERSAQSQAKLSHGFGGRAEREKVFPIHPDGKPAGTDLALPSPLDLKYLANGKFAPGTVPKGIRFGKPSDTVSKVQEAIPRLGDLFSKYDSEEWSDTESLRSSHDSRLSFEHPEAGDGPTGHDSHGVDEVPDAAFDPTVDSMLLSNPLALMELLTSANGVRSIDELHPGSPRDRCQLGPLDEGKWIAFSQLVAAEAIHLQLLGKEPVHIPAGQPTTGTTILDDPLSTVVSAILPSSRRCDLLDCVKVGQPPKAKSLSKASSTASSRDSASRDWYQDHGQPGLAKLLPTPDFRVCRGDATIDLAPSALQFWEELGLSPRLGEKDVLTVCCCEDLPDAVRGATMLLENLSHTYRSLKLGSLQVGDSKLGEFASGLVLLRPSIASDTAQDPDIEGICARLGRALQAVATPSKTIIIHLITRDHAPASLVAQCSIYWRILNSWEAGRRPSAGQPLKLQVVPQDWIRSNHTITIHGPAAYVQLAKMVYDKAGVTATQKVIHPPTYATGSLFELAPSISSRSNLRLSTSATLSTLTHAQVVHIGYSWRPGRHWLAATITDDLGCHEWRPTYYVGNRINPYSVISEIATHILGTALELMGHGRAGSAIVVAKMDSMNDMEVNIWSAILAGHTFALICIDTDLPIQLLSSVLPVTSLESDQVPTPMPSTPEVASPDPGGARGPEDETNARLVDKRDEYSFAPAHKILAYGDVEMEQREAVLTGYLVRGGGEALVSVEVVRAEKGCDPRDIISSLHGLCVLARARGSRSELPWHLAVAQAAAAVLEQLEQTLGDMNAS